MKRLPITQDERMFLKAIESTAMVVLLMFKIYPTPLNADTLAFDMKWDARKAKKMMDDLSSDGFTSLMKGQGYVLTSAARNMVVEFFGNLIALPLEAQALAHGTQAQAQQVLAANPGQLLIEAKLEQISSTHSARALEEVEESSLILDLKESTTSNLKSTQNVLETRTILMHTSILFGDPGVVLTKLDLDAINPHYALGWVAQAYDQRRRSDYPRGLDAPAGLVYSRLRDIEQPKPRESYYVAPEKYLPDAYLDAIGLLSHVCASCQKSFSSHADLEAHESLMLVCEQGCGERFHTLEEVEAHHAEKHVVKSSAPALQPLATDDKAARAWESVLAQLKLDMPSASFNAWVSDTQAVQYDGLVLTVGVHNEYACDWLESRLQSTVEKLLVGILNAEVKIRFVVADMSSEEGGDE